MSTVAMTQFKVSLSKYFRKVKQGEEILVTEPGRPVARLLPVCGEEGLPEHLQEMVRQGQARAGTGKIPKEFWNLPRPSDPEGAILRALLDEREESNR